MTFWLFFSSPGALLQVSLCHGQLSIIGPSSVVSFLHFRHLLQTRKLDWAETRWEASEWLWDSELLKSFHSHIHDGCMAAIYKFFRQHLLPNHKSDWAKTWWEASERQRFRIAKIVSYWYPRWPPWRPSWNSLNDISSQTIGRIELKQWETSELHRNSELHWSDIEIQNC